jgi:hypothetical protein
MSTQSPLAILPALGKSLIHFVRESSTFNYYGPFEPLNSQKAAEFLARHTDAAEPGLAAIIESFLSTSQQDCVGQPTQKNACWFTIRITQPSESFKIPRWHQDGRMFVCDVGQELLVRSKYALTLLGPATLMLQPSENTFRMNETGEARFLQWRENAERQPEDDEVDQAYDDLREWLAGEFEEAPRIDVGEGEIVRFSWGQPDSPLHSEPDLISDRVFMTVLFGSESELRRMCDGRGEEYRKYTEE